MESDGEDFLALSPEYGSAARFEQELRLAEEKVSDDKMTITTMTL